MRAAFHPIPGMISPAAAAVPGFDAPLLEAGARNGADQEPEGALLRESESLFRSLCAMAPIGIFQTDSRGAMTYASPWWYAISGLSVEQTLGDGWRRAIHPDDRDRVVDQWARATQAGTRFCCEHRILTAAGVVRWVICRTAVMSAGDGRSAGYVGTIQDITERKRSEEALRESEERLRFALRAADMVAWDWDLASGRMVRSEGVLSATGAGSDPSTDFFARVLPEDRPAVERALAGALAAETPYDVEFRLMGHDGQVLWMRDRAQVSFDSAGRPVRMAGICVDISEHKRTAAALHAGEKRFRAMVERSWDGVALIAPDGTIEYASPATFRLLGCTAGESAAPNVFELIHPDELPGIDALIHGLTDEPNASVTCEYRNGQRDGGWHWIEATCTNLLADPGVRAIVANFRDITEQKHLEDQLRQSQKMEAIGRLAGGTAHDFNNMIGAITGYADLLLHHAGPDPVVRGFIEEIMKAGDRAAALTRQLLAFSRKSVLAPRLLDLNEVVANVYQMLRRVIGEDIELVTLADTTAAPVKADPAQIEQVLLNLAINARDAMAEGGTLTIETKSVDGEQAAGREPSAADEIKSDLFGTDSQRLTGRSPGPWVMLVVSDTGCGMDCETLARIFEPFFTTKEQGKGTGLGLATVYGIVEQSGGRIEVESQPGAGATFRIYFPRCAEAAVREPAAVSATGSPGGSETILLVEDEPAVRRLVKEVLRRGGYTVLEAIQGDDALRLCREHTGHIDLLLTDVMMPGMSGRELAQRWAAARPDTRVLFMSGYADDAVLRNEVFAAEAAFIQKPFKPAALAQKIRDLLGAHTSRA